MKLCWDNIENIRLTVHGNFRDIVKGRTYHFKICKRCGEEFLGPNIINEFCTSNCIRKGQKHTEETKRKISKIHKGKKITEETKEKLRKSAPKGENNHNWTGGYNQKGLASYNTYASQLEWAEEVRRNKEDSNVLEVRCFKCDSWFVPSINSVTNRIQCLKNNYVGYNHFYCSDKCKNSCSVFGKSPEQVMKEDAVRAGRLPWLELRREVQPELRSMVLERDEHKCVKCGDSNNLQCHHILPVSIEPLFSADVDNCVSLCYTCHKKVHQEVDGCKYDQLKVKEC